MKRYSVLLYLLLPVFPMTAPEARTGFITIPATSYEIVDGMTGIPVEVSVDAFMISKTEVTQGEFHSIMNYNPSHNRGREYPVENVSWWEAIRYCNERSKREGLQPCYDLSTGECDFTRNGYRLPTDAEWSCAGKHDAGLTADTIHAYGNLGSSNSKSIPEFLKSLREKGTEKVGSFRPDSRGLYDMTGNVWEWCSDFYNPQDNVPLPLENPGGPAWGTARIIRGGSFISMVNSWSRGYRSSMEPDYKSRFTGFRLSRSIGTGGKKKGGDDSRWFEPYNRIPDGFENNRGNCTSLTEDSQGRKVQSLEQWREMREEIKGKWERLLGTITGEPPEPSVRLIRTFHEEFYTGKLMYLQVEPDFSEKIYLMMPDNPVRVPTPVVITPYYDVDTPAGKNMGGRSYRPPGVRSFAYLMARQGYIVVAVRWFGESYGEHYGEAVANLKLRHPECTGLGKWVWDARRVVDYICTLPEADRDNIGIIGHSLGGKMALYAAAMDERIRVAVSSELGIGLGFSNYDDFWYYGDFIRRIDSSTDHHELLALLAPRPFLLIGGDEYDTDESWYYINAARDIYTVYGKPQNIGYFNHRTGHTPTPEAVRLSVEWLKHFLSGEHSMEK